MRYLRSLIFAGVLAVFLAVAVPAAFADSPHFLYANSSISSSTGALTVSFKDAGLGTGVSTVTITLDVFKATATYHGHRRLPRPSRTDNGQPFDRPA